MGLITAPATFISILTQSDVWLERTDFQTRSTFTSKRQVISYPSASYWRLAVAWAPRDVLTSPEYRRFVMALRGRENWFQCPMPLYPGPSTGYSSAIKVDGASQSGFTLNLKGLTPLAEVLGAGDFFTVVDQCFTASADVTANALGKASVTFDTPLRTSPADNADIEIAAPYFLCAASNPNVARWQGIEGNRSQFAFEGEEHIA